MIRTIALHLATAEEKKEKEKDEAEGQESAEVGKHQENTAEEVDHSDESTDQQIREKEAKLSAVEPGMNRLQWDLRYPYATEITGYHAPIAEGGMEDSVRGPVVVPGTYSVALDYGGQKTQQSFVVALDPRFHPTPQDLASHLAVDLQIHADLDALDKDINRALLDRDKLQKAVSEHGATAAQAATALAALNRDIESVAQMAMKSSEGSLLYETKLRDYLAYLASDIDLAYGRPTAAQEAVFRQLDQQAKEGEQKLEADLNEAERVAGQ